jgi:phosphoribosylanthranilate isomerase
MRIRTKICGITREQDAIAAVVNGADAIGLVFYQASPRHVSLDDARVIVGNLPPFVARVGLFVNAEPKQIESVVSGGVVDILQFHGDEPPEACGRYGLPYIKAIAMRDEVDIKQVAADYGDAAGLLVDTYVPGLEGGSGLTFDWSRIPAEPGKPLILAGGLNPENVGEAIHQVRPYAVDVSSGVESSKGIKDAARIAAFINEVNKSL